MPRYPTLSNRPPHPAALSHSLQDLYVAPVALVGCGMGAAVALVLAAHNPYLVGAVVAGEFALPAAALQQADPSTDAGAASGGNAGKRTGASGIDTAAVPASSSTLLMPWWGFRAGQATAFDSVEQCAAFLAHPLANVSPWALGQLVQAAQAVQAVEAADAAAAARLHQLLAQLARPLQGAMASACAMLPTQPSAVAGGWQVRGGAGGSLRPRTDPTLLFHFDPAALVAGLPSLPCHLLLVHGGRGSWVEPADAAATARLASEGAAASVSVTELRNAGHCLAADQPDQLLAAVVGFLEGPAILFSSCTASPGRGSPSRPCAGGGGGARRPECLDLKPLPEYATLEEARKVRVFGVAVCLRQLS